MLNMEIPDLGCWPFTKKQGSIGIDITPAPHVDCVHDLNEFPSPFEDNKFDYIEMSHILEHLKELAKVMEEVFRIAKPNGTIRIITPHYTSQLSYGDLTHFHHFGYITFLILCNNGKFRIEKKNCTLPIFIR